MSRRHSFGLATQVLLFATAFAHAGPSVVERVEISGPILPRVLVLYQYEGANYPTTAAGQAKAVHDAALTFPFLLQNCVAKYPTIKVRGPNDPPLTPAELATNFNQVAQCSYEQYTSKPYWIPQFIDDVDVCGNELGTGWRLITEADIASLSAGDFQFIQKTLTDTGGATSLWSTFYFSLHVYARATDGTLKLADLTPVVIPRISPLPPTVDGTPRTHLEGDTALRCIRRTVH